MVRSADTVSRHVMSQFNAVLYAVEVIILLTFSDTVTLKIGCVE